MLAKTGDLGRSKFEFDSAHVKYGASEPGLRALFKSFGFLQNSSYNLRNVQVSN